MNKFINIYTMGRFIDMTGKKFGRLTVIKRYGLSKDGDITWECVCECGGKRTARGKGLRYGFIKSCGCLPVEMVINKNTTHGLSHDPEYSIYCGIKSRCYNKNYHGYKTYGGRGIIMCKRWIDSYENFILDMGKRPSLKHSVDRIDNNGPYSPENCRWATRKEQGNNTSKNYRIKYMGMDMTLHQWSEHLGINYGTLHSRIRCGWSDEDALLKPVRK